MSNPGSPASPPKPAQPRGGCGTAFLFLLGVVLLLPGFCSLFFVVGGLSSGGGISDIAAFWVPGIIFGALGVLLIGTAARNR